MRFTATILTGCVVTLLVCNLSVLQPIARAQQDPYRQRQIAKLLEIVRNEPLRIEDPDKVALAIARLGELQAADAIDDLIKLITFKRTFPQDKTPGGIINELHTITRDGRYPAVGSLFLIGKPSLSALTKLISDSDPDSLETENALEAVKLIFRDEPKAGVQCLKGVAEKSQYPLEKERLLYAAKRLENFTP